MAKLVVIKFAIIIVDICLFLISVNDASKINRLNGNNYAFQNLNHRNREQRTHQHQQQQQQTDDSLLSESSENVTVILGQNAILPCSVRNIGSYKLLWLRVRDGDILAFDMLRITQDVRFNIVKHLQNEWNLVIESVTPNDTGEYACQINTNPIKAKIVYLNVLTPPSFYDKKIDINHYKSHLLSSPYTTKSINVVEGKQVTLECTAHGNPKPVIVWYVKSYNSVNVTEFSKNTNKITIKNLTRNQYEYFECIAYNNIPPSISKTFKINVNYKPIVTTTLTKLYVYPPVKLKLDCFVNSFPESALYWSHNNQNLQHFFKLTQRHSIDESNLDQYPYNSQHFHKYNINVKTINETFRHSSIFVNIESEFDYGTYECYANNSIGFSSIKINIHGEHVISKTDTTTELQLVQTTQHQTTEVITTVSIEKNIDKKLTIKVPTKPFTINKTLTTYHDTKRLKHFKLKNKEKQTNNISSNSKSTWSKMNKASLFLSSFLVLILINFNEFLFLLF